MTRPGEFTTHARQRDHVVKRLTVEHPAGARFAAAMARGGSRRMRRYLDVLRDAGVLLADDMAVHGTDPLTVRHRWMDGPTLAEIVSARPEQFVDSILVIDRWVRALHPADARVDTNLTNFCLTPSGPVLVDVLPALIPSQCPDPLDSFDVLFHALCFDTPTTRDALAGYALRLLINASAHDAARRLVTTLSFPAPGSGDHFPGNWFRARRALAVETVHDRVPPQRIREVFALTSVLGFRQLAEPERLQRIRQVEQLINELGQK